MQLNMQTNKRFWRNAVSSFVTLAGLAALVAIAPRLYKSPPFRFPAMMTSLMSSRAVLFNPGVNGYYEQLFGTDTDPMFMNEKEYERWSKGFRDRTYERSFRLFRFRPNLRGLRDRTEPQGLTTNSFGFLGPERSLQKPPNTRRVALLGDSMAQGWGTDQNLSWVSLFEKRLNETQAGGMAQRFEVLNFALPGCLLTQMLDLAEEDAPRFEPDVYVLALTEFSVHRNWAQHFVRLIQLDIDPKYDFLRDVVSKANEDKTDTPLALLAKLAPYRIPVIRATLAKMKSHSEHEHVPFLVILIPSLEDGGQSRNRFAGIQELLASLDIPTIDLLDTFDGIWDLNSLRIDPADVHPNAKGHAMILENLYRKLRAQPKVWNALIDTGAGHMQPPGDSSTNKTF
jgi:lysophospholipase L1-like esterase